MNTDRVTVRAVTFTLAFVVCFGAVAMLYLTLLNKSIPDQLDRIVSIALGALGAMLAKTSTDAPADVTVVNKAADPVPVELP